MKACLVTIDGKKKWIIKGKRPKIIVRPTLLSTSPLLAYSSLSKRLTRYGIYTPLCENNAEELEAKSIKQQNSIKISARAINGTVETRRLIWLVSKLNKLLTSQNLDFVNLLSKNNINHSDISEFKVAGGAQKHYDITTHFKNGTTKNIEHKAIKVKTNDEERPWSLTPQLFNATYNFTSTSKEYCRLWHTSYMPILKEQYPSLPEIPTFEAFLKKDASMGSAKTEFGKALKTIRNENQNNKKHLATLTKNSIKYFWKYVIEDRHDILEQLKNDIQTRMQEVLEQKHLWLNAYYPGTNVIETSLIFMTTTPQISNIEINPIINEKQHSKIKLFYNLSSNPDKKFEGEALLRWGNGNGIANIRWNIS